MWEGNLKARVGRERERDLSETTHMYLLIKNITMGDEVKKGVWPI